MKENKKITRIDILIMAIITILYAVLSFMNLGDKTAPYTRVEGDGEKVRINTVLSSDGEIEAERLMYFEGLGKGSFKIYSSDNGEKWTKIAESETGYCFTWQSVPLSEKAKFFKVTCEGNAALEIYEMALFDKEGNIISVKASAHPELFDEQEKVPSYPTYKNGTYFDEIYHARTAYENVENIYPYEVSHPPLGKLIISVGIRIFGMNPFGWRVMGNIFGILMVPLMYLLGKRIFKNSFIATAVTLLLSFDFMHFAQTRIATIDSFSVFFIMLMYYFMYIYFDSTKEELPYKKSLLVLFACGLSFGLGIATKWICAYAGAGLAILYFIRVSQRSKQGESFIKTCYWCVLFFVIIPFIIYFASYAPYFAADSGRSALKIFTDNQNYMLSYHSGLEATHPFQCPWYTWPIMTKPIWYYGATEGMAEGLASSIVSMGNPAIWWLGTLGALALLLKPKKDNVAKFLSIGYLSQYLPWVVVGRIVFIYHYFASVPFIILSLGAWFKILMEKNKKWIILPIVIIIVAAILFTMFYPILSGMEVRGEYIENALRWFEGWSLYYKQ